MADAGRRGRRLAMALFARRVTIGGGWRRRIHGSAYRRRGAVDEQSPRAPEEPPAKIQRMKMILIKLNKDRRRQVHSMGSYSAGRTRKWDQAIDDELKSLVTEYRRTGPLTSISEYETIIIACSQSHDVEQMKELVTEARRKRLRLTPRTYSHAIRTFCNTGRLDDAIALYVHDASALYDTNDLAEYG
eukprot:jgi/Bigna1/136293/aug1.33_g11001